MVTGVMPHAFVLDTINEVLEDWQATRFLSGEEDISAIDQSDFEDEPE